MSRSTAAAAAVLAALLLTGSTAAAQPDDLVRVLDPEVRVLDPQVRSLREESTDGRRTLITISSDVLFDFDSAELTEAAGRVVDETGAQLAGTAGAVSVVGHTDGIGSVEYNQVLSEERAAAVASQLRTALGAREIATSGRGATEPVASETRDGQDDPAGRALNRRVVIAVDG